MLNWFRALFVATLFMVAAFPAVALAFGTVNNRIMNQHREHEQITRAALVPVGEFEPVRQFEPKSLDLIAGRRGTWGAVGTPDAPLGALIGKRKAHCDNGDFLNVEGDRPPNEDEEPHGAPALEQCRVWIMRQLDLAISAAKGLVRPSREALAMNCPFHGSNADKGRGDGRAKCAVLEHLGFAFHASQDFYAHSNWSDVPRGGEVGLKNPPGLVRIGLSEKERDEVRGRRAEWLDPRVSSPAFPEGLISGCYEGFPEWLHCGNRVKHARLNKDKGEISLSGVAGEAETPRGKVQGNFAKAVAAAIDDTKDKWAFFKERVLAEHGEVDGDAILCAVVSDNPSKCECRRRAALLSRAVEKCDAFVQQGHLSCTVTIDFEGGRKVPMQEADQLTTNYLAREQRGEWCDGSSKL